MADQQPPPGVPPHQPPGSPTSAATQAMPAAQGHPTGPAPGAPRTSVWRRATSTRGRRLALAASNVTATVNGSVQALTFQRGVVTAVSATSITLKSSDGFVGTFGRTGETVTRWEAPVKGGQAFVVARRTDKVALTILSTPAGVDVAPSS